MQRTLALIFILAMATAASAQTVTRPAAQITPQVTPPSIQAAPLSEVQTLRNENAALRRDLNAATTALRTYARCQREILALSGSGLMSASSRCPGTQDANLQALYNALPAS